jgi:Family of unknown function (DUF6390)
MTSGALLFGRYAYPPNALGYCGPDDPAGLLEQAATPDPTSGPTASNERLSAAREIGERARSFEGAWPYLQLIAGASNIGDPLDRRVVEAYWIGNALLDNVTPRLLAASIEARFRPRAGRTWDRLAEVLPAGSRPHHSFHVFAVYPWIGLLRAGHVHEPLRVLDQCRVRWGTVEETDGNVAVVRTRPLIWDGSSLRYGPARPETVTLAAAGLGFVRQVHPGEWVSLHWDWVCDRLSDHQRRALEHYSALSLTAVNRTSHPAPAAVLS